MRRNVLVIATVGILLGLVLAGSASAMAQADTAAQSIDGEQVAFATNDTTTDTNETDGANETVEPGEDNDTVEANETSAIAPGTYLSGAVGAHRAELEGAVTERAFGLSVAAAVSNGSKAKLVANQTTRLDTRLQELEQSRDELEAAFDAGSIKNGTYQAQMTALSARISATERMINRTINESARLPNEVRQTHGVNETRLDRLRTDARNLSGPEVAGIARTIAGPMTGMPAGERGPPAHAGQGGSMGLPDTVPDNAENTTSGPPVNTTPGPTANTTPSEAGNTTVGQQGANMRSPSGDNTRGPPENETRGPPADSGRNTATVGLSR